MVPYATDLGISATSAAVILAIAGGMTIIGQTALGSTGDKIGNRQAFLIGIGLFLPVVVGLMLARELWMFYLIAVIFGLGFGDCTTQESPLIAWLFGLKSHGLIYGFFTLGFSIGAAIGPVIFGYIFDMTGNYQFAFLTCATLSIIAIILLIFLKSTIAESTFKTVNSKAL
jgi:MFS family permease